MTRAVPAATGLLALAAALLAIAAPAQEPGRGARLFERCAGCHALEADDGRSQGPSLHEVFGRRAAAAPGFDYSPALRRAGQRGLVWTPETLDAFLADPAGLVRGTWMGEPSLTDPADRADLIAFLREATR